MTPNHSLSPSALCPHRKDARGTGPQGTLCFCRSGEAEAGAPCPFSEGGFPQQPLPRLPRACVYPNDTHVAQAGR